MQNQLKKKKKANEGKLTLNTKISVLMCSLSLLLNQAGHFNDTRVPAKQVRSLHAGLLFAGFAIVSLLELECWNTVYYDVVYHSAW
jgi:hypothetical protein